MGELWLALLSIDLVHDELSKMKNETANSNCNCNLQRGNNGAAARSQAGGEGEEEADRDIERTSVCPRNGTSQRSVQI